MRGPNGVAKISQLSSWKAVLTAQNLCRASARKSDQCTKLDTRAALVGWGASSALGAWAEPRFGRPADIRRSRGASRLAHRQLRVFRKLGGQTKELLLLMPLYSLALRLPVGRHADAAPLEK